MQYDNMKSGCFFVVWRCPRLWPGTWLTLTVLPYQHVPAVRAPPGQGSGETTGRWDGMGSTGSVNTLSVSYEVVLFWYMLMPYDCHMYYIIVLYYNLLGFCPAHVYTWMYHVCMLYIVISQNDSETRGNTCLELVQGSPESNYFPIVATWFPHLNVWYFRRICIFPFIRFIQSH
jgi:hypothetical protein